MNVENHVKTTVEELAGTEDGLAPTRAHDLAGIAAPPIVLRFDRLPATPVSLARIRRRVEEINRRLRLADAPFRLRVM